MDHDVFERRSLITGMGAAVAAVGLGGGVSAAQSPGGFRAAKHPQDEWLDRIPGTHRIFIDAATPAGAGTAIRYASTLYGVYASEYQLADTDLAIVVCLRAAATRFGYNDAMWAKYGKDFSQALNFVDPATKAAPSTNLFNSTAHGWALPNQHATIDGLVGQGVTFAVCNASTRSTSRRMADPAASPVQVAAGGSPRADEIYKELAANLIPRGRLVSAGILAAGHAQERGYTYLSAG